jgi:hypothetical protein
VANAIAGLPIEKAVFDGEVVVEDRQGIADFAALQDALKVGRNETIAFYVFDLLHLNGHDVKPLPLLPVSIANARSSAALPRRANRRGNGWRSPSLPILKRHRHSQAKSVGREIDLNFRPDLLRQHPFQEHRAKPVAAARRHRRFREFVPFA